MPEFFDEILVTTMTAIVSASVPIIFVYIKRKLKERRFPVAALDRLNKLRGYWYGYFNQLVDDERIMGKEIEKEFPSKVYIESKGRRITGECEYEAKNENNIIIIRKLRLFNGYFDGHFIKIEYENKDKSIFQKGSFIARLDDFGKEIVGQFVGYSPTQEKIIHGNIKLRDSTNDVSYKLIDT